MITSPGHHISLFIDSIRSVHKSFTHTIIQRIPFEVFIFVRAPLESAINKAREMERI